MNPLTRTSGSLSNTTSPQQRLEEVVLREAPALLAYLTRRVSNPADAADLLGDVLVVVWRRIDTMPTEPGPARMWMFGIARKTLASGHRSNRRCQALTARLRHEIATANTTAGLAGNNQDVPADPRAERLTAALDHLSPADREILTLIHWDFLTLTEVAQHLRLRPTTTRSRYHRARVRVKQLFELDETASTGQELTSSAAGRPERSGARAFCDETLILHMRREVVDGLR